jgi:hypothetical protein
METAGDLRQPSLQTGKTPHGDVALLNLRFLRYLWPFLRVLPQISQIYAETGCWKWMLRHDGGAMGTKQDLQDFTGFTGRR